MIVELFHTLGAYGAVPAVMNGQDVPPETWNVVVAGLRSAGRYWKIRYRLRQHGYSFQLIRGPITQHEALAHLKGIPVNEGDRRTFDTVGGYFHAPTKAAYIDLLRARDGGTANVIAHERGHMVMDHLFGFSHRPDVRQAHENFVQLGYLTGSEAVSAHEWLAEDHAKDCMAHRRHPAVADYVNTLYHSVGVL